MLLESLIQENNSLQTLTESQYNEIFNEAMINSAELKKVDACFDRILATVKEGRTKKFTMDYKVLDKEFYKIEAILNKLFNIELSFGLDIETKYMTYIARVIISKEDMRKISEEILMSESGYSFKTIRKTRIEMQDKFIMFCKDCKLDGRYLTSVMLHEIGHKIFLKLDVEFNDKVGNFSLAVNGITIVTVFTGVLTEIFPLMLLGIVFMALTSFCYKITDKSTYVYGEMKADNLATYYGYGVEGYKIDMMFSDNMTVSKYQKEHKFLSKFDIFKPIEVNKFENTRKELVRELSLAETKVDKEYIQNMIDQIDEIERSSISKNRSIEIKKNSVLDKIVSFKNRFIKEDYENIEDLKLPLLF